MNATTPGSIGGAGRNASPGIERARPSIMSPVRRILVPIDFDEASSEALARAVELARRFDASITLLHVVSRLTLDESRAASPCAEKKADSRARWRLEEEVSKLGAKYPRAYAVMRRGKPSDEILSALEDTRADLVVMGSSGRPGSYRRMGSVAEEVARSSSVPVLTVRPRLRDVSLAGQPIMAVTSRLGVRAAQEETRSRGEDLRERTA
jgi:nucleotide-binding universal stress UspA family protein